MMVHIAENTPVNPRFFWTYADEDMVRIVTGIAKAAHPRTLALTVMHKWAVYALSE